MVNSSKARLTQLAAVFRAALSASEGAQNPYADRNGGMPDLDQPIQLALWHMWESGRAAKSGKINDAGTLRRNANKFMASAAQRRRTLSAPSAKVGDWVFAGRGEDADYGHVDEITEDGRCVVSWNSSQQRTTVPAETLAVAANEAAARANYENAFAQP